MITFEFLRAPDRFGYNMRFVDLGERPRIARVEFVELNRNDCIPKELLNKCYVPVVHEDIQRLFDMLWKDGFRPSGVEIAAPGTIDLLTENLKDLRHIVRGNK